MYYRFNIMSEEHEDDDDVIMLDLTPRTWVFSSPSDSDPEDEQVPHVM